MLTTSAHTQPSTVLPETSTTPPPTVPVDEFLSAEDKMIFYAVLQDIANELRRMNREHKKHCKERSAE